MNILLCEDNPVTAEALRLELRLAGHQVEWAADGHSVMAYLTTHQELPDVILLDYLLPGMDGEGVLIRLSDSEEWRHLYVVLMTAVDHDTLAGIKRKWPGLHVLRKPFDPPELLAALKTIEGEEP